MTVNLSNKIVFEKRLSTRSAYLRERALGRQHAAARARLAGRRLIHRARERLESGLDDMMRVAAADQIEMQVHPNLVAQGLHEVVHQFGLESPHPLLRNRHVIGEIASAADV